MRAGVKEGVGAGVEEGVGDCVEEGVGDGVGAAAQKSPCPCTRGPRPLPLPRMDVVPRVLVEEGTSTGCEDVSLSSLG